MNTDERNSYSLKRFCQSVAHLDGVKILDAICEELHAAKNCGDTTEAKSAYVDDLAALLSLFFSTSVDEETIREGFARDAYSLLRVLEEEYVAVQSMKIVKIAKVIYADSDETYYVLNRMYENAERYICNNKEDTVKELLSAGWVRFGRIVRWDEVPVEAFKRDREIIAVWNDAVSLPR